MSRVDGAAYMGSGLAQTYDPKSTGQVTKTLAAANSAASLTNYTVPSLDGRLIPAIPIHLALKFKPPTVAVVYTMKDHKSKHGRQKKYIHEIKIVFTDETNLDQMCQ